MSYPNDQGQNAGNIPVRLVGASNLTPVAVDNAAVAVGGTAVIAVSGPANGGYITNPSNAAAQAVAAENLYVDPVAAPGSTDATANGTTTLLLPGQSYSIPALAAGQKLWVNAATSGHKYTGVKW